jgi:hypothetical protein
MQAARAINPASYIAQASSFKFRHTCLQHLPQERWEEKKMPQIVATMLCLQHQGQGTHFARTNIQNMAMYKMYRWSAV